MADIVVLTVRKDGHPLKDLTVPDGSLRFFTEAELPDALAGRPELVIIDTPLASEFGDDTARRLGRETTASVLLLVDRAAMERYTALEAEGIFVVPKPPDDLFLPTIRLARIAHRRLAGVENENRQLHREIEEIQLVSRAKAVLMQVLKLSEPQAHRYIEKQAMDRRITRREVARNVLNTYDCR